MRWFYSAVVSLSLFGVSTLLYAQNAERSIWDGVYTATQAERGKAAYDKSCAACHGDTLDGHDEAPPLRGPQFMTDWDGQAMADLVQRVHNTMPLDNPGSLDSPRATDVVAYLLQQNSIPAGAVELSTDPGAQAHIHFTAVREPKK